MGLSSLFLSDSLSQVHSRAADKKAVHVDWFSLERVKEESVFFTYS